MPEVGSTGSALQVRSAQENACRSRNNHLGAPAQRSSSLAPAAAAAAGQHCRHRPASALDLLAPGPCALLCRKHDTRWNGKGRSGLTDTERTTPRQVRPSGHAAIAAGACPSAPSPHLCLLASAACSQITVSSLCKASRAAPLGEGTPPLSLLGSLAPLPLPLTPQPDSEASRQPAHSMGRCRWPSRVAACATLLLLAASHLALGQPHQTDAPSPAAEAPAPGGGALAPTPSLPAPAPEGRLGGSLASKQALQFCLGHA